MTKSDHETPQIIAHSDPGFDAANRVEIEEQLALLKQRLQDLPVGSTELDRANILLDMADAQLGLGNREQAWSTGRMALDSFVEHEQWQRAVETCSLLYQTEQPASIVALGHGVWLAVTYPVEPEITVLMLSNIVDETPAHSDGAAVAAATSHYIAGLRTTSDKHAEGLGFITTNLIARVAERHSDVTDQQQLNDWMDRLELREPQDFLPRLATVVDILVDDQWWFDREELRSRLPVH